MGRGTAARRLSVPVSAVVEDAIRHPDELGLEKASDGRMVAALAELGVALVRRAKRERRQLELYERYEQDPERRLTSPELERIAREGGVF